MAEISTAPVQALDDGGYLTVVADTPSPTWARLAVADVQAGVVLAETALQPEAVGSAAYLEAADVATTAELTAALAAQVLINEQLQAQIDALAALVGVDTIEVYETGIYEPGMVYP